MDTGRLMAYAALAASLSLGACNKSSKAAPDLQTTTSTQTAPRTVTVSGCLRAGTLADNTWVLIAGNDASGAGQPANYQLMAADASNLRANVGQHIEVTGTVRADDRVATSSGDVAERAAKGTSGTPQVETKTDVDLRKLDVTSVKPLGGRCE